MPTDITRKYPTPALEKLMFRLCEKCVSEKGEKFCNWLNALNDARFHHRGSCQTIARRRVRRRFIQLNVSRRHGSRRHLSA